MMMMRHRKGSVSSGRDEESARKVLKVRVEIESVTGHVTWCSRSCDHVEYNMLHDGTDHVTMYTRSCAMVVLVM